MTVLGSFIGSLEGWIDYVLVRWYLYQMMKRRTRWVMLGAAKISTPTMTVAARAIIGLHYDSTSSVCEVG
jgi:hypothetical protein